MNKLFLAVFNRGFSVTGLILAVLLVRLVWKQAPKWVSPALWGLVGLRLILPFSLESGFSLMPSQDLLPMSELLSPRPTLHAGAAVVDGVINPLFTGSMAPQPGASVNPLQVWTFVGSWIWLIGLVLLLLWGLVSYVRLRLRVRMAVREEGCWLCEAIPSPFVLGLFRPKIYMPYGLSEADRAYVLAHEQAHLARKDHWWKPLGFLLLALYWFQPLLWVAYWLFCRDLELACDERVLRTLGPEHQAPYAQALLNWAVHQRQLSVCPLAFGEVGVKERVRSILSYRRPGFWVVLGAVVLCGVLALCFLTDPVSQDGVILWGNTLYEQVHGTRDLPQGSREVGRLLEISSHRDHLAHSWGADLPEEYAGLPLFQDEQGWLYLPTSDGSFAFRPGAQSSTSAVNFWPGSCPDDQEITLALPGMPEVSVSWKSEYVCLTREEDGQILHTIVYEGYPVWSLYLQDLTGDGVSELVSQVSVGFGFIDQRIVAYDPAVQMKYELSDRGTYDYVLSQEQGSLWARQYPALEPQGEPLAQGRLVLENGVLGMEEVN